MNNLINQLKPKTWNWSNEKYGDISQTNYGFLADDLELINSNFVQVAPITDETHGELNMMSK